MSTTVAVWILLFLAIVAANLPWISERLFLFIPTKQEKHFWQRLIEWAILYVLVGALAMGLERKVTGGHHAQEWEFYTVTFFLFLVFALPGFIYRHDLRYYFQVK